MLRRLKPSPAMAVALLALFVALGGSGYAAVKISGKDIKNRSIAAKKLKNRTITARQVKRGSLTGKQVKAGSLTGRQVKADSLTGTQIREQSLGTVPRAGMADALAPEGAKSFVPAGRFHFGELVRMAKTGTEANTPLRTLVQTGPFKVEVGCYVDADKTGAKLVVSSTEANSVLDWEQGTTASDTWSSNVFDASRRFITLIAPSGATVGVIFQAVLNGLGTDCAYVAQYTTNR